MCKSKPMSVFACENGALRPALTRRRKRKHYAYRIPANMMKKSSSVY